MALNAGQCAADPVTGLAGRVFTRLQSAGAGTLGMLPDAFTAGSPARNALAGLIEAIAGAVVEELTTSAQVHVTINTGNVGLQRYVNAAGDTVACLAPSANHVIDGVLE